MGRRQLAVVQGVGYPNADSRTSTRWRTGWPAGPRRIPSLGLARSLARRLPRRRARSVRRGRVGYSRAAAPDRRSHAGTVVPTSKPGFGAGTDAERPADVPGDADRCAPGRPRPWHAAPSARRSSTSSTWRRRSPGTIRPTTRSRHRDRRRARGRGADDQRQPRLPRARPSARATSTATPTSPRCTPSRMQELNDGDRPLLRELDPAWSSHVTVMTFSEFGRTSWDNDGQGTDHGTAAPHFVLGANVKGGLYGAAPALAGLDRWERMAHSSTSARTTRRSSTAGWAAGRPTCSAARSRTSACSPARPARARDGRRSPRRRRSSRRRAASCRVSPFRLVDTRDGTGGVLSRPLGPWRRLRVPIAGDGASPPTGAPPWPSTSPRSTCRNRTSSPCTRAARRDRSRRTSTPAPGVRCRTSS